MSENGGDRELVLSTKHLLAIFFVGALLCGVFFAVGYVVGGNSAKSTLGSDATTASATEGKREQPQADSAQTSAAPPSAYSPSDAGGQLPAAEPHMADNPAAAGPAPPATTAAAPPPPAPVTAALSSPPETKAAAESLATGIPVSAPEQGASYVQVVAEARPKADNMVKSLREAKLPVILAESSKPGLFRVLVGPYRAPLALADAKRKLKDLGFNQPVVYKQP